MELFQLVYANSAIVSKTITVAGVPKSERTTISAEEVKRIEIDVPAAKPGELTTRTDNDTGTLTMESGHGIITGDRLDLYWDGGCRRGITVGTVAGLSVPIDLGAGDNLPLVNTEITAMVPIEQNLDLIGDDMVFLMTFGEAESQFVFVDSGDVELLYKHNVGDICQEWYSDLDPTNPLDGDTVDLVYLSHADSSDEMTLSICILND